MRESKLADQVAAAIKKYLLSDGQQAHLIGSGDVAQLEEKLIQHYSMRYALCVSNATTGLLTIALALDLKGRDFVTSPLTYGASVAGWLLLGNRPIFADTERATLTLDSRSARRAITAETRAILSVDIFGNPADQVGLRKIADEFGLWYIADAAQSLGAYRTERPASSLADALVVSFTSGKTVFAGEGGAILTNNADLYQKLVWHCQHPFRQRRDIGLMLSNEFALNGRIHPLAAVWANATFEESLERLKRRQARCFEIIDALNSIRLTEGISYKADSILPSFFRLSATWKKEPKPSVLKIRLNRCKLAVMIEPLPAQLIYQQPAFLTQFRRRLRKQPHCPIAERYARGTFCISLGKEESSCARQSPDALRLTVG